MILLLKVQLTAELRKDLVDIVNVETSSIHIKIAQEIKADSNFIIVFRLTSQPAIPPKLEKKYSLSDSFLSGDTSSTTGEGNYIIYLDSLKYDFTYGNLSPDTYYNIDIYHKKKDEYYLNATIPITTLAELPERQTQRIMWAEQTHNSFKIIASGGTGKSVLIALSSSPNDFVPVAGVSYKADSCFGKGSEPVEGVFIVLSEDSIKTVEITNLESGTYYYITTFEYNGKAKSCNYLTETVKLKNAIRITTLLETPELLSVKKVGEKNMNVVWKEVNGAKTYIVELAHDPNFEVMEETYGAFDLGILSEYLFEELPVNKKYYVRVRATNGTISSTYSDVLSIDL